MKPRTINPWAIYPGVKPLFDWMQWQWGAFFAYNVIMTLYITQYDITLPAAIEQFAYHYLPVVRTPVDYLWAHGKNSWAANVQTVYTFNWLTFLVSIAISAFVFIRKLPAVSLGGSPRKTPLFDASMNIYWGGLLFSSFLAVYSFPLIYDGNFDFGRGPSLFKNKVHRRFLDIFQVNLHMTCVGALAFFAVVASRIIYIKRFL